MQKPQEPSTTADQRQTTLWQQTMEIGRQARQEATAAQHESSQERDYKNRQRSL